MFTRKAKTFRGLLGGLGARLRFKSTTSRHCLADNLDVNVVL